MKSRKQGRNYIVQFNEDEAPEKFNRKLVDTTYSECAKLLRKLARVIKDADEKDCVLAGFLLNHFNENSYSFRYDSDPGGWFYGLIETAKSIEAVYQTLQEHDDEIREPEDFITLADLGFRQFVASRSLTEGLLYEKVREDTKEKEVVEEIYCNKTKIMRRLRTTIWEEVPHGRHSKSINYRKLRMGKKLLQATENTIQIWRNTHEK